MAQRPYSLRRRLIATTLGSSVACWLVSLAIIVGAAWQETSDVFDDALEEGARTVAALGVSLQQRGELQADDGPVESTRQRVRMYYQIMDADGTMLRRSRSAPQHPFISLADVDTDHDEDDDDFSTVRRDGKLWRVYVLYLHGPRFYVQTAQPWEDRAELLEEMAERLTWPALILLLLLGLINWFVIRRLLRPLEQVAQEIGSKSQDDLQPVSGNGQARELIAIIDSLNRVFHRLDQALQSERRFTADAAHELRTPLAALRMKIQLMQRTHAAASATNTASGDTRLSAELRQLRDDVDRCTALVENLLALARLDPQQPGSLARSNVDATALVDQVLTDCGAALQSRAMQAQADISPDARAHPILAHGELLQSALRNILENAIRYGHTGGTVMVRLERFQTRSAGPTLRITVMDNGPGVAPEDLERLTQRFFRVLGTQVSGSGLGLSIVARIVQLHGGQLHFGPGLDGRGLAVIMELPQPIH